MRVFFANFLWALSLLPDSVLFFLSLFRSKATQEAILKRILDAHNSINEKQISLTAFDELPLKEYEEYEPAIDELCQNGHWAHSDSPILLLEPTSGSSGNRKLIPYTKALKSEFNRAIAPWIFSLFCKYPRLLFKKSYWSVSPPKEVKEQTESGISIGFEDDSDYLGPIGRWVFAQISVLPPEIKQITDEKEFRFVTQYYLCLAKDLGFLSIWSPSFLPAMLVDLEKNREAICAIMAKEKELSHFFPQSKFSLKLPTNVNRAQEIRVIPSKQLTEKLCKNPVISTWGDGPAHFSLQPIRELFPTATIDPKGLLSTEAVTSIPFGNKRKMPLAVRSHYYECLIGDRIRPLYDLNKGDEGELVITTGSGFLRYRTGDMIQVTGKLFNTPTINFLGRNKVSDLTGEKLSEAYLQRVLQDLQDYITGYSIFIPDTQSAPYGYKLFVSHTTKDQKELNAIVEDHLMQNYHYRLSRENGQLRAVSVVLFGGNLEEAVRAILTKEKDIKAGDIKLPILATDLSWIDILCNNE